MSESSPAPVRRRRREWLIVAIGVLLGGVSAALLYGALSSAPEPNSTPPSDWAQRINACGDQQYPLAERIMRDPTVLECGVDVVLTAAKLGQEIPVSKALRDEVEKDRRFYYLCHNMLHEAGARALPLYDSMADMVARYDYDVCGYAYVHGGLDAFGYTSPTLDDVREVGAKCAEMTTRPGMERTGGLCAHGLGHVAWLATKDMQAAIKYCAALDGLAIKSVCGNGITMEMFQPVAGEAMFDVSTVDTAFFDLCEQWPDPEQTGYGCYQGAGYGFTRDVHSLVSNNVRRDSALTISPQLQEQIRAELLNAMNLCHKFDNETGVGHCLRMVSEQVPGEVYKYPDIIDEVCKLADESEDFCRSTKNFF